MKTTGIIVSQSINPTNLNTMSWRIYGKFAPHIGECLALREGAFFCKLSWSPKMDGWDDAIECGHKC